MNLTDEVDRMRRIHASWLYLLWAERMSTKLGYTIKLIPN